MLLLSSCCWYSPAEENLKSMKMLLRVEVTLCPCQLLLNTTFRPTEDTVSSCAIGRGMDLLIKLA